MHNLYKCQYLDVGWGLSIAVGQEMPPDWIGLLLMIVRDKLTKNPSWSLYIQGFCATCLHVGSGWVPFKDWGSGSFAPRVFPNCQGPPKRKAGGFDESCTMESMAGGSSGCHSCNPDPW